MTTAEQDARDDLAMAEAFKRQMADDLNGRA